VKIAIHEIPEEGLRLSFSTNEWLPKTMRCEGDIAAGLVLYNKGRRVLGEGFLRLRVVGQCDRCLRETLIPIETDFQMYFERDEGQDLRGEKYLTGEDLDAEFIESSEIDIFGILQQQLYLSMPVKCLCKESCLGLCSRCGQDLNLERCHCSQDSSSPFAALSGLLKEN